MLFNQTNQFKKQEFQTVKKKEQTDSMVSHFCTLLHKEVQPMAQKERATVNRNYKDTVFRMLFSDRRNLLSLYNAISGAHYDDPEKLEIGSHCKMPFIWARTMILLLSLTQSYFYMNTSQLTILICHCVIYSIFRVNIRNWWIRNPFILPYYRKYLHHNLSYFTMEQKRKNKAEVIAMSIFEYDKEEEERERKLRKAEYEAGVESGIAEGKRLAQKEGTIALSRLGLPVEQIAMALQVDVELAKQWIGDK